MVTQLSIWSILPIFSAIGGEFLINNSTVTINKQGLNSIFFSLRGLEFILALLIIFMINLNQFKNCFLRKQTLKKIM